MATTRTSGKPTAKQRTLNMFNQKTELEEPNYGSPGRSSVSAPKPLWKSIDGYKLSRWERVGGYEVHASKDSSAFVLYARGRVEGTYPTITEAVAAAGRLASEAPVEHRMDED